MEWIMLVMVLNLNSGDWNEFQIKGFGSEAACSNIKYITRDINGFFGSASQRGHELRTFSRCVPLGPIPSTYIVKRKEKDDD